MRCDDSSVERSGPLVPVALGVHFFQNHPVSRVVVAWCQ